jgi:hypothetical protein
VAYLGHVISEAGDAMDVDKVAAVSAWPQPRPARGLHGFLGLAGYYRKFICDFGLIAAPLTRLLRRDAFTWDKEAEDAFQALKRALTTGPILQMPDFDGLFIIDFDASGVGFGAVLHQGAGPVAFFSRPFAARHLKLAAYERELIGLVQAVRHWRPYLCGRQFLVRTDHLSLNTCWTSACPWCRSTSGSASCSASTSPWSTARDGLTRWQTLSLATTLSTPRTSLQS